MKVDANQIPPDGLILFEEFGPQSLDLDTGIIKFSSPVKVKAQISRITNAVSISMSIEGLMALTCSRCLEESSLKLKKYLALNYSVSKEEHIIDLDPQIREEIILDYPLKPLCKPDCKGLCPKCGKNLNQGGCSCGTT
jgi:uncharacterized protein